MRWLAAAVVVSVVAFSAPARASDSLAAVAGLAPLDDATLASMTGGAAASLQLGAAAEAGAPSLDLNSTNTLQASISHSPIRLAGALATGDISLEGISGATGGITTIQLSTGFNDIQQSSATLAFVF